MILNEITGLNVRTLYAERSDSTFKLREGHAIGALVTLKGTPMYEFLEKLITIVLPRIREWPGMTPERDPHTQRLKLVIPKEAVGFFPEIEVNFEKYPRFYDLQLSFETSCPNVEQDVMLLTALGMPFRESPPIVNTQKTEEVDPYAKYRKEKTARKEFAPLQGILTKK
jgi:large subunit ribosomal protein L5